MTVDRFVVADTVLVVPQGVAPDLRAAALAAAGFATVLPADTGLPGDVRRVVAIAPSMTAPDENLHTPALRLALTPQAVATLLYPGDRLTVPSSLCDVLYPDCPLDPPSPNPTRRVVPPGVRGWAIAPHVTARRASALIEALLRPRLRQSMRIGLYGLGDIGRLVATLLFSDDADRTGIEALYLSGTTDPQRAQGHRLDLEDIHIPGTRPRLHVITPGKEHEYFECDLVVVLVGPRDPRPYVGYDVRTVQYAYNRATIARLLDRVPAGFGGHIVVCSDPVEQLTFAAYVLARSAGVSNDQFLGFGTLVDWMRAVRLGVELGCDSFAETGRIFGSHGRMTVALPASGGGQVTWSIAERLSLSVGHRNLAVRAHGGKPHLAAAIAIARGLIALCTGAPLYASAFVPAADPAGTGAFFGTRLEQVDGTPIPRVGIPRTPEATAILERVHRWLAVTSRAPDALAVDPFDGHKDQHPAFHPDLMARWHAELARRDVLPRQSRLLGDEACSGRLVTRDWRQEPVVMGRTSASLVIGRARRGCPGRGRRRRASRESADVSRRASPC